MKNKKKGKIGCESFEVISYGLSITDFANLQIKTPVGEPVQLPLEAEISTEKEFVLYKIA